MARLLFFGIPAAIVACAGSTWVGLSHSAVEHSRAVAAEVPSARIDLVSQDQNVLALRFVDKMGRPVVTSFQWSVDQQAWTAPSAGHGVVFGNDQPRFASTVHQRRMGVTPQQAIRSFDASIADRPMDDVTIFALHSGDLVIGLWMDGAITELWFAGEYVSAMLETNAFVDNRWDFCERSESLCCRKIPNPTPGFGQPTHIPHPNVAACTAVIQNCPGAKDKACGCLNTACNFCFEHGEYCDPDEFPWLPGSSEASCVAGTQHCVTPPDDGGGPGAVIVDVLEEIADRLQVVIDLQNASQV